MKLGFFPDPFPDELLYSVCARYGDWMKFPHSAASAEIFLGKRGVQFPVELPSHLNHLVSVLPPGHQYTADYFITHHTLAPLYFPFMPQERTNKLLSAMKEDSASNSIHALVGQTTSKLKAPRWLRFCPICAAEEQEKFGIKYWHRLHQIPNILVCVKHNTFLEESPAIRKYIKGSGRITSAEYAIQNQTPRYLDLSDFRHRTFLKLAQDISWLLSWRGPYPGMEFLRERYHSLLLKSGLAYYNGRNKTKALSKEIEAYFSPSFLSDLQCKISNHALGWVFRLINKSSDKIVQHPLRHLLLFTFLGLSAQEFFNGEAQYSPFGIGPWPCLNKAAGHYKLDVITECRVVDSLVKGNRGKPHGIFKCACGFIYTRFGPDENMDDRFRLNSILEYGYIWEEILKERWDETTLPLPCLADELGVAPVSVVRHAIRLSLPMNKPGHRKAEGYDRHKNPRRTFLESLEHYRHKWQVLRTDYPKAGRTELIALDSFTYLWLNRHDKEWLEAHLPPVQKRTSMGALLDWGKIDRELSVSLEITVKQIRELPGKPVRISIAAIVRQIGYRTYLEQALDKLPQTSKVMKQNLESLEAHSLRCINWAESQFRKEGVCPSRSEFIYRAGIRNKTGKKAKAQTAIEAALHRLRYNN